MMTIQDTYRVLADTKTILLSTRKRDGTWVSTPVTVAVDLTGSSESSACAYFRTYDRAGKAKRLRNFPDVTFTPATSRGRSTGPSSEGRARLLDGDEARRAARALARRAPVLQGLLVPLAHRVARYRTLHYELTPTGSCHHGS